MLRLCLISVFILLLSIGSVGSGKVLSDLNEAQEVGDTLSLPEVKMFGTVSVEEAIATRRSVRSFEENRLTLAEVSQLLWAAQGVTDASSGHRLRAAPSAGALYPLEVYALWEEVLWRYIPEIHALEMKAEGITGSQLAQASLGQSAIGGAPACFVISGDYARTRVKYRERAERYVHMEVGHAAENLLLQAGALGLGGVTIGAFQDPLVKKLLELPENESPLYIIPVGHEK